MCGGNKDDADAHCAGKPPGDQQQLSERGRPAASSRRAIPGYERQRLVVSLAGLLLLFAAFGIVTYGAMQWVTVTLQFPMYLFALPPVAVVLWAISFRVTRWNCLRRARAADDQLCLTCFHDLRAITGAVCPECGKAFSVGGLRAAWRGLATGN